jgi:diaminohydroxyphosphoribosylaminopyrimidine deaminase/5-amino-6-(5-phosphoribosylamino)uracil reductase
MAQTDQYFMAQAIRLARKGWYTTFPNPRVGCVLTKNNHVIAEGWHKKAGEGHAEVNALAEIDDASGATAYVTLEPCSHQGKTPPCADALINAGVSRVVIAMEDPNPLVAGNGIKKMLAAGIDVTCGVLEAEARTLNTGFISRMEHSRPFIRCKLAMSLDGRTGMQSGESQWITGSSARTQVQRIRAASSAIITGISSIIYDDSSLTVRSDQLNLPQGEEICQRQPLRVVLDSQLRTPLTAKILRQPGETVIAFCQADPVKLAEIKALGVTCVRLPADPTGRVALAPLMEYLHDRECNDVLLETGATLAGAFAQAGLIDELIIFMAPTLLGHGARGLLNLPGIDKMADQIPLELKDCRLVGSDLMLTANFKGKSE